ncbi:copper fist DNA binding domain-containing protein [Lactifluus subvellereus]|nr:copper fist DNA binding domain-containing protein [Lactifluus subvellereus]
MTRRTSWRDDGRNKEQSWVFINSQKFACESCIKGHRSSSCTHTERPLYEIKKKGRPVSQCERCRQLRNTKRVHSKCTCSEGSSSRTREVTDKVFGTKQKRYIPIVPALPNGLKDAFNPSNTTPIAPAHPRQKVASLLNPCQTSIALEAPQSNGEFASAAPTFPPDGDNGASSAQTSSGGLEALARAAVLFSSPLTPQSPANHLTEIPSSSCDNEHANLSPVPLSCQTATPLPPRSSPTPVLDLPPLLFPEAPGPTPVVPPFSTFTTLAGSGCTCGLTCQCPDCASHRPGVKSSNAQDCMNCVDQSLRVIDPSSSSGFHVKSPVLEKFLAEARRVPPPPTPGGKPVELPKLCCGGIEGEDGSKDLLTDAVVATGAPAMKS